MRLGILFIFIIITIMSIDVNSASTVFKRDYILDNFLDYYVNNPFNSNITITC